MMIQADVFRRTAASAMRGRRSAACLLLTFFLLALPCAAQEYVFRAFRQAHGLDNLSVSSIAADAHGTVWVGTQNGLFRFLGQSFQRFGFKEGIAEKGINVIVGAPDGTLWVGTDKNLYRWNDVNFEPAAPKPFLPEARKASLSRVRAICCS